LFRRVPVEMRGRHVRVDPTGCVLAADAGLMAVFGPSAGVFIPIYISLCAYIVVEIVSDEIAG